jgi:CheY-like chemotaxis protein
MRLHVLIIEDDVDLAEALSDVLEQLGYVVKIAHSGIAAFGVAHSFCPDVVLCDLSLPGQNGFEIARTLRSHPETAKARLIALSGDADAVRESSPGDDCFDSRLLKPIDSAALQRALG